MARPSGVRVTSQVNTPSTSRVVMTMAICMAEIWAVKSTSPNSAKCRLDQRCHRLDAGALADLDEVLQQ